MATEVLMPQLGESVEEATISRWLKSPGDEIEEYEPLLEVNTDKVDSEIPSPASGTLLDILVKEGTVVKAGTVLATIGEKGETPAPVPEKDGATQAEKEAAKPSTSETIKEQAVLAAGQEVTPGMDKDLGFISPVVARMASEHHLDLVQIEGTGQGGRITKKDVQAYLERQPAKAVSEKPARKAYQPGAPAFAPPAPQTEPQRAAPTVLGQGDEIMPLTQVRRSIAEHMVMSKRTSPHVTTIMEADLKNVVAHRSANKEAFSKDGASLTFTPYFISAVGSALKAYPVVNSSWSDEGIVLHKSINIGMATSLDEEGLIVPVIKDADSYSLLGLARTVNDLAERARGHKLQPDEVRGGTFTITNHGTSGSLFATPIINQPQCGILGVGLIQKRVVVIDDAIAVRPMVYLSFTFDHRILDGAIADHFLSKVVESLEQWH